MELGYDETNRRKTTIKPVVCVRYMKCLREWPESNAVLVDHTITFDFTSYSDPLA